MCISSKEWRILKTTAALQRVEKYLLGIISQRFLLINKGHEESQLDLFHIL